MNSREGRVRRVHFASVFASRRHWRRESCAFRKHQALCNDACCKRRGDDAGLVLFVLKDKSLPYRRVARGGVVVAETFVAYLPRGAVLASPEDRGRVDSVNFFNWAKAFVASVKDLTNFTDLRRLPLPRDFHANCIVFYALPAHTSGKTQP